MMLFKKKAVAAACTVLVLTGCGDIVVKVSKKPKNVDTSAASNFGALNLDDPSRASMLSALDNLRVIAVDLLIKELAKRDYRSEVREQIRKYFDFVITKANGPISFDDAFYTDAAECRETGLSFDMFQQDNAFGLILKTAVLAKLSEVNAGKINPGLSKEIQAIGQIILKELGLEIKGDVDVMKEGEATTTKGSFSLRLLPIDGEKISDAQKAKDASQVLDVSFERMLGANYIGYFNSTMKIGFADAEGNSKKLQGILNIKREAVDNLFVHTAGFELGHEGGLSSYSRELVFKQMASNKKQIQIMDTINPKDLAQKSSYMTLVDLEAGTQCKMALGEEPSGKETSTSSETSTSTSPSKGDSTTTEPSTSTEPEKGDSPVSEPPVYVKEGSDLPDTGIVYDTEQPAETPINSKDDDEDWPVPMPMSSYSKETPAQSPSQTPVQSPTQSK